jgi:hypothetical protein
MVFQTNMELHRSLLHMPLNSRRLGVGLAQRSIRIWALGALDDAHHLST